jgi:hypothetical protein
MGNPNGGLPPLVHSLNEVAVALRLIRRNGEPNRKLVQDLIRDGKLPVVGGHWRDVPIQRWTVSTAQLRRYIDGEVSS